MAITKTQLCQKLADQLSMPKKQAADWLEAFVDIVTGALRKGEKVNISGFGIFKVSDRKAREGVNPRTGERIHIPASKKPRFTPGKLLKEAVQ